VARHVLRHEAGALGLFKGLTATLGREIPGNVAMFGVYELLKAQFAAQQVGCWGWLLGGRCTAGPLWVEAAGGGGQSAARSVTPVGRMGADGCS
jgi:solute carrier family 25 carnitine/acylcarnitine transporter 20/29